MSKFTHLEKMIALSGSVLPSVAMEAIKVDLADKLRQMDAGHGEWLSVDADGDVFISARRPYPEEAFDCWECSSPVGSVVLLGTIPASTRLALRLDIYWRDYLLEI